MQLVIMPVYKKRNKASLQNYNRISLLNSYSNFLNLLYITIYLILLNLNRIPFKMSLQFKSTSIHLVSYLDL